ncbi:ABC transporter substrate-binding protein [Bradyrhizobium iriomotense]|uniref:ABC transporter substrate-binding protein n=1 Tax=Bradyrhizobium iriomotense TaxID=441950 RepID=A0ABQ6AV05_9BRAD|nr:ABC transporter substrate-binding protein [Bradyrhizobium iriomotense]GLR85398.1 ABC transporter substrate-binding protein [Bradyrhizobium iriomotense]
MDHVKRREFMSLLASAAATWPLVAFAQSPEHMRRIGVVMAYAEDDPNGQIQVEAFRETLATLGWVERKNVTIDVRYARGNPARARELGTELLRQGFDLMVSNSNLVTAILQTEVRTIPLVFISVSDPVGSGFVKELARPGGNITGFANFQPSMGSKWLEKLHELAPQVDRVGLLLHPEPPNFGYLKSAQEAAPSLNIRLFDLSVHDSAGIESALANFAGETRTGLIVAPNVVSFANSQLIVALAARYRLPAIYPFAFFAKEGGLISYGFDERDQFRQGAVYVDKILRGAKPADLPVQYPTKFDIVINLKTARALGIVVPLQLIPDLVIE